MTEQRRGFLAGIAAYTMWGSFPLYWPLLEPSSPAEILAHRIVWSMVTVLGLLVLRRRVGSLRRAMANRRSMLALVVAALVIGFNWFMFIYGVTSGQVVETSLGYFINPLVTVLMGVVILGERLRRLQWLALGLALLAVLWLAVDYGRPPWLALALAFSFGTYGLAKKKANAGAIEGLAVESVVLAPIALAYLGFLHQAGQGNFGAHGTAHMVLLMTTGIVTAVPLLCFGTAATRISLTTIGMLQYITPSLQFMVGVLYYGEPMPTARWIGFILVWIALAVLTAESISHRRRVLRRAATGAAP